VEDPEFVNEGRQRLQLASFSLTIFSRLSFSNLIKSELQKKKTLFVPTTGHLLVCKLLQVVRHKLDQKLWSLRLRKFPRKKLDGLRQLSLSFELNKSAGSNLV
jgi:hypothetical protein